MSIRKVLDSIAGALGVTLAASVFCLPCWIPVLMAINALGLGFLLHSPIYGKLLVSGSVGFTAFIIAWLGDSMDGACAFMLAGGVIGGFYVIGASYIAYVGFVGLGLLLWKCRSNACKIVR